MINTALLKPQNLITIAAIALIARFLFSKALNALGGSSGANSYAAINPAG